MVLGVEHFVEGDLLAAGDEVAIAAFGPFVLVGGEEDFALGVREDDRALVAAFGDDVLIRRRRRAAR